MNARFTHLGELLLSRYRQDSRAHRIGQPPVPSSSEAVAILRLCQEILFPGYFGHRDLNEDNIGVVLRGCLEPLHHKVAEQMALERGHGEEAAWLFLDSLPEIRRCLALDAQAAVDGDPAVHSLDEVILAYPGFLAITVHRLAHQLHHLGAPLLARLLSEWAHTQSGADIHPAAHIGESFFLDHASGVVIGATSHIGKRVRLYQGVTLGALSFPRDAQGKLNRVDKRHPTLEDDVTVYAHAIVLGGNTVVGRGSVVGASVMLTRSIPPQHRVILDPPKLRIQGPKPVDNQGEVLTCDISFEI